MNITKPKGNTKREKVLDLMKYHKKLFAKEGELNPKFIPRLRYKHNGEYIIGFYLREIYGEKDIYVELCSRDLTPEDPTRTLWKWEYNPHYATDYELSEPHPATGDQRYLIPFKELINVTELYNQPEVIEETFEELHEESEIIIQEDIGAGTDIPYSDMTLRDYAAIQWKKPVSHRKWLNELINNTFK